MNLKLPALILTVIYLALTNENAFAQKCNADDYKTAEIWKYYQPEDAYNFGLIIKNTLSSGDKSRFLTLFDNELSAGPRREYIKQNKFDDIFSQPFIESILNSPISCSPFGWRGFFLEGAFGTINYDLTINGEWKISAIYGASEDPLIIEEPIWSHDGQILHPSCFTKPYISNDNFEEFVEKFAIEDQTDFFNNPSNYYGNKIQDYDDFTPSWCSETFCPSPGKISLGVYLENCPPITPIENKEIDIWTFRSSKTNLTGLYQIMEDSDGFNTEWYYSVLGDISQRYCEELTIDLDGCIEAKLIEVADYSGGSFGWLFSYGIFGLFELPNQKKIMLPLKYFATKNDALNILYLQ